MASTKRKSGHVAKFSKIAKACHIEVKLAGITGKRRMKAVGACVKKASKKS